MWGRWCVYLLSLVASVVFYGAYREWFSWLLLMTVASLPWFSFLVSLPGMLTAQCRLSLPESARMDMPVRPSLEITGWMPAPLLKSRLLVYNKLTDKTVKTKPGQRLPTDHCGYLHITYETVLIGDYLGLWRRRLRKGESVGIYIEPKPVACALPEQLQPRSVSLWKPKPGGGFAENHELRLYRPGDDLRLLHFKMSAKTGKLIYREPVVQQHFRVCLALTLSGKPAVLDDKLGRLLYLSDRLLRDHIPHEVRCRSGLGDHSYRIENKDAQLAVLRELMSCPATVGEWEPEGIAADRLYQIGGAS